MKTVLNLKAVLKRICVLVIICSLFLAGCSSNINYNYDFGKDGSIENGSKVTDGVDPFSEKGIYADPELEIDGVREAQYDYPTGSGRYKVYDDGGSENAYVSIYKGERGIYYIFECKDDCLSSLIIEDTNLATAQSDSVELYVDTYGTGGKTRGSNQYEFRVTAAGRIYSYLTGFVARVFNYGTLNFHTDVDTGFNVEGYISYSVLGDDVDKNTPTSFAFARVTKTGNRGHVWHGNVDPQVPDNYLVLNPTDNKFYTQKACPANGTVKGKLVDVNNNAIEGAKVSVDGYKTSYTDANGEYSLDITECTEDINVNFTKKNYLARQITVAKNDLRHANKNTINLGSSLLLEENASTYDTVIKGAVTERDGTTPIKGVTVSAGEYSATTDTDGKYVLNAQLSGYESKLTFASDKYLTYTRSLYIADVNIDSTTDLETVNLDENEGSSIDFGKDDTTATARIVRSDDSFKLVLKTESNIDIKQNDGSNFEVFVDTKDSCAMNMRDATDYLFVFQYADEGVLSVTNYGGNAVNTRSIKTTYGRINEQYYVEADIPYSVIGVSKDEVFGLYFGLKVNYVWTGMYSKGDYIQAEATVNYVRVDGNSQLFKGSCNVEPFTDKTFNKVGTIGDFGDLKTPRYDVSYCREGGEMILKIDLIDNGIGMTDQSHSLNIYVDMNASASKTAKDAYNYHISVYPGRPISMYCGWDVSKNSESATKYYEIASANTWAYLYKNTVYIKINTSIFGGDASNSFGFAMGMWSDVAGKNSILKYNGTECDFGNPAKFFIVDTDGNITI